MPSCRRAHVVGNVGFALRFAESLVERRDTHAHRHLPICVQHSSPTAQGRRAVTDFSARLAHRARMACCRHTIFTQARGPASGQQAAGQMNVRVGVRAVIANTPTRTDYWLYLGELE
jgi:hypothetical protein